MKRDEYFSLMDETSKLVHPILKKYIGNLEFKDRKLYDIMMRFVKKRLTKPLLKPTLLRLSYEICGGKEWEKIMPIAASLELINISSYQANASFDGKLGVISTSEKDSQFIASMISRELSVDIINDSTSIIGSRLACSLIDCISKINFNIYLAQHYDLNILDLCNIDEFNNEEEYLNTYQHRCYLGSGIFNGQCALIGALLANANQNEVNALEQFGNNYGTALQIINDIGDYIPNDKTGNIDRSFQDQFSDFKNGRLTLPLYHLIKNGNTSMLKKVNELRYKDELSKFEKMILINILIENNSIEYSINKAKYFGKKAKNMLNEFPNNKIKNYMSILLSIITTNKYLHVINDFRNQ